MDKYHEAINFALGLITLDIDRIQGNVQRPEALITYRRECMAKLAELQNVLLKIAQLKQSLKELDLEESK